MVAVTLVQGIDDLHVCVGFGGRDLGGRGKGRWCKDVLVRLLPCGCAGNRAERAEDDNIWKDEELGKACHIMPHVLAPQVSADAKAMNRPNAERPCWRQEAIRATTVDQK